VAFSIGREKRQVLNVGIKCRQNGGAQRLRFLQRVGKSSRIFNLEMLDLRNPPATDKARGTGSGGVPGFGVDWAETE
jgi:hypothetical protein